MKPLISLVLLTIFHAVTTITGTVLETARDYEALIVSLHEFSRTSPLSLIYFTKNENLAQRDLIFNIQVSLSRNKIMSSAVDMRNSDERKNGKLKNYRRLRRGGKMTAMNVFLLTSREDIFEMEHPVELLRRIDKINLVLFTETVESHLLKFCIQPRINIFPTLRKGVSLLIKCHGAPQIREWYNATEFLKLRNRATWSPNGLILKSENLVWNDREILNGRNLIVFKRTKADMIERSYWPYLDEICNTLKQAGHFETTEVHNLRKFRDIDLLRGMFTIASLESDSAYEFSETLANNEFVLLIKQPERKVILLWSAYFKIFTTELWIALILSFLVIQAIRAFMRTKVRADIEHEEYVVRDFTYICGIFCQQGLPELPRVPSLRIFYSSIFLFALSIWSTYDAAFTTELTMVEMDLPFNSLDEFIRVKSHKLIVYRNSYENYIFKTEQKSPWKEAGEMLVEDSKLPDNIMEAYNMVCQYQVAFFVQILPGLDVTRDRTRRFCPMNTIKMDVGHLIPNTMLLPREGLYNRAINQIFRRMKSTGILKRILAEFFRKYKFLPDTEGTEKEYPSATLRDISVLMTFFFGSIVLSLFILSLELLYHRLQKMRNEEKTRRIRRPFAARLNRHKRKFGRNFQELSDVSSRGKINGLEN